MAFAPIVVFAIVLVRNRGSLQRWPARSVHLGAASCFIASATANSLFAIRSSFLS
ncbi:hypothetical protein RE6C_02008 [Rhodopirellula europaea 6C]|uniref:Uncharacterized protein n=1 Tax=Rhodopirellula europaea 6C TaxID=1263867 RepID=M2AK16_9BACT|nr:hypothetical protein RE6C_02008 [Rhodopirellula europaea 6C]